MRLLVLDQRQFDGIMDQVPGLAHKLLQATAARLREADRKAVN
jgi:CRP-like cAMP-binding protein